MSRANAQLPTFDEKQELTMQGTFLVPKEDTKKGKNTRGCRTLSPNFERASRGVSCLVVRDSCNLKEIAQAGYDEDSKSFYFNQLKINKLGALKEAIEKEVNPYARIPGARIPGYVFASRLRLLDSTVDEDLSDTLTLQELLEDRQRRKLAVKDGVFNLVVTLTCVSQAKDLEKKLKNRHIGFETPKVKECAPNCSWCMEMQRSPSSEFCREKPFCEKPVCAHYAKGACHAPVGRCKFAHCCQAPVTTGKAAAPSKKKR